MVWSMLFLGHNGNRKHGEVMFVIVCRITGDRFISENNIRTEMSNCRNNRCMVPGLQECYDKYGRRNFFRDDPISIPMLEQCGVNGSQLGVFKSSTEATIALGKKNGKSIDKAVKSGKVLYGSYWKIINVKG